MVVNILNETITEGKVKFAVDGQNNPVIQQLDMHVFGIVAYNNPNLDFQGGRSCAGARGAPAEKFGLGRKF